MCFKDHISLFLQYTLNIREHVHQVGSILLNKKIISCVIMTFA